MHIDLFGVKMRITENELRRIIRQVILEESRIDEGPRWDKIKRKAGEAALAFGAAAAGMSGADIPDVHAQKPSYEQQLELSKEQISKLPKIVRIYIDAFKNLPWQQIVSSKDRQTLEGLIFGTKSSGQNNTFFKAMYDHGLKREKSDQEARQNAHEAGLELQHVLQKHLGL